MRSRRFKARSTQDGRVWIVRSASWLVKMCFAVFLYSPCTVSAQQSFVYTNIQSASPIPVFNPITVITNSPPDQPATIIRTITAPVESTGHRFTHWTVGGVRVEDITGRGANPVEFGITNNINAVAHYTPLTSFTGDTQVPDWYKIEFYGSNTIPATSDTDGDGFDLQLELFRDYHPRVLDLLVEGGVARRRAEPLFVITDTNISRVIVDSIPVGINSSNRFITNGSVFSFAAIPSGITGFEFVGWFNGNDRVDSPNGTAAGTLSLLITNHFNLTAHYVTAGIDSDVDGLLDSYELYHFNALTNTPASDPDGDGFDIRTELLREYHPRVTDLLLEGGVARRRAEPLLVINAAIISQVTVNSDPTGIYADSQSISNGLTYSFPAIPSGTTGFDFVGWFIGANRMDSQQGLSAGILSFQVLSNTTMTARFVASGTDNDTDGINDSYELYHFNTLTNSLSSDPDGDGFDIQAELLRSYHPQVTDLLVEGGVARRRAEPLAFVPPPPDFALQPVGVTNVQGNNVTLIAEGRGIGPFFYQWRLNGVSLTNATNATLTLTNAYPTNGGGFSLVVSTPFGASNSQPALVVVETGLPGFNLAMADTFTNAPLVTNDCRIIRASNEGATFETGEPAHANKPVGKSVWLKWRASADGIARFGTRGSSFDTVLAVYDGGPELAQLTEVVSDDDSGGFYTSDLVFGVSQGKEYWIVVDGLGGFEGNIILSWCLEITQDDIPRFVAHPSGRTVAEGARVPLVAQLVTRGTPSFQWYKNAQSIEGATRNKLVLENVGAADVGVYRVAAWVGGRTNFSQPADIQLSSRVALVVKDKLPELLKAVGGGGGASSFNGVTGSGGNRFQTAAAVPWERTNATVNAIPIAIGSPDTHIFDNFSSATDAGEFPYGGRIWLATDHMERQPATNGFLFVETRSDASDLLLAVTELLTDDYRVTGRTWFMTNSSPGQARLTVPVKGGTNYFITWATAQREPARFTNNILLLDNAIRIAQQPVDTALPPAGSATLRVVAGHGNSNAAVTDNGITDNLSYQWLKDGAALGGGTGPMLNVSQAGTYAVVVSNGVANVTSSNAIVSGAVVPGIVTQPIGIATNLTALYSLTVDVSGSGPLQYQWRRDGTPIVGAKGAIHTIDSLEAPDFGDYDVIVSNLVGSVTSSVATVSFDGSLAITLHPVDAVLLPGTDHTLRMQAAGPPPLRVQWLKEGQMIPSATNMNLVLTNVNRSHSGRYRAVVTNATDTATSSNAVVRVLMPTRLQRYSREANGLFRLRFLDSDGSNLPANIATSFVVEASSDFQSWTNLTTNGGGLIFTNGELFFEDTNAINYSRRYYRVLER